MKTGVHDRLAVPDGLIYIHDPMCSWCWAFRPALEFICARLTDDLRILRVIGGLAPDSQDPMPETVQRHLAGIWKMIEHEVPGTRFNHDFWKACKPRRSTFPACRAVIAARNQGESWDAAMTSGIQKAYYLDARNPSDDTVLIDVAASVGLDAGKFRSDFYSGRTQETLEREIRLSRSLGVSGFPSIVLSNQGRHYPVPVDYRNPDHMIARIRSVLEGE